MILTDTAHMAESTHTPEAARIPESACTQAATHTLDVSLVANGEIDVVSVPATFRGSDLRKQLAKQYSPDCKIKLFVLKHPDGSWPSQDDALKTVGVEMRYVSHLRAVIGELGDEDIVHLRVEVTKQESNTAEETQSDGDHSSLEDRVGNYNMAMSKKRKQASQKVRFTDCDEATTEAMYKNVKRARYVQKQCALPDEYVESLRVEYRRRVIACGEPWLQSESQRRLFINSMLVTCVAAAIEVNKQQLSLTTEKIIKPDCIDGGGIADYVISKGDRMVVIIEAKKCDMEKAQHQNFAAMEAARVLNSSVNSGWRSIDGICTDFQNWIFIQRKPKELLTDHDATLPAVGCSFPEDMLRIASKVYGMLLEL